MSIRCLFDGGKYFNHIQRGSFQYRCNSAGLAVQHGPAWPAMSWQTATNSEPGIVLLQYTLSKSQRQKVDCHRKETHLYKVQRRNTRHCSKATTDTSYGPNSQQDDLAPSELAHICQDFFHREVAIPLERILYVEQNTRLQADDSLWHQQRRLRLTASNFGRVAKRRSTTPVGNLVKSLLYGKSFSTEATRWGSTHEADAKKQYLEHLKLQGHTGAEVEDSGLIISSSDPCLACSPDGLVNISGSTGILEIKCPHKLAKDGFIPVEAARTSSSFFCKLAKDTLKPELKRSHNYFFQVQGTMAITNRSWCDFVVWTPHGFSVERIAFDNNFWEEVKAKLFYDTAVLPELAVPLHTHGQAIREPASGQ